MFYFKTLNLFASSLLSLERSSSPLKLNRWHRVRVTRTGLLAEVQVNDRKRVAQLAAGAFTQVSFFLLTLYPIIKTGLQNLRKFDRLKKHIFHLFDNCLVLAFYFTNIFVVHNGWTVKLVSAESPQKAPRKPQGSPHRGFLGLPKKYPKRNEFLVLHYLLKNVGGFPGAVCNSILRKSPGSLQHFFSSA